MQAEVRLKPSTVVFSFSILLLSTPAYSAGFALIENSASGQGKAFAGAAAAAEDASTVWFNPAGMTYLGKSLNGKSQLTQAGHIVSAKTEYTDRGSSAPTGTLVGKNANERVTSFIPNLYYVRPVNERLHFGLGINGPFGSKTLYDDDWIGRYNATDTDLLTINVNPSLSWKASDKLSIGGGISAQYVDLKELSSAIDSAAVCRSVGLAIVNNGGPRTELDNCIATYPTAAQPATDSHVKVEGDDISFGFNLGLLYEPTAKTRLGVSYRSEITHDVDGTAKFDLNAGLSPTTIGGANLVDRNVKATITLPESVSVSVAHKVNTKLELLSDVTWTGWSSFDQLLITNLDGTKFTNVRNEWEDVYRFSIGANYKYNDKLILRTGIAYDEEPIPSAQRRTPRIPGNDRTWLSFGAGYKLNKKLDLDVGYTHLFLDDALIDNADENGNVVRGSYDSSVDILSAQVNYTF
jgi:long-chain fatty acid transport protein